MMSKKKEKNKYMRWLLGVTIATVILWNLARQVGFKVGVFEMNLIIWAAVGVIVGIGKLIDRVEEKIKKSSSIK
jgi:predicted membrane protein